MRERGIQPVHHRHRQDRVEVFGIPVFRRRRQNARIQRPRPRIAAQLAATLQQRRHHPLAGGKGGVEQQRFHRPANAGAPHLGVQRQRHGHLRVRRAVNIGVANPIQMREHRHPRIGLHPRDQALAPARHDHVDEAGGGQHRPHHGAVLRRHQLHRLGRRPRRAQPPAQRRQDRPVGIDRLAAPAQQHGITTAQAQRGGIGGHIGPALVNDADQPDGHAHPAQMQPIGPLAGVDHLPHRVGQNGHLRHGIGNPGQALRRQPQPVEQRAGQAIGLTRGDVAGVGGQNGALILAQRPSGGEQRGGFLGIAETGQQGLRRAPGARQPRHQSLGAFAGGRFDNGRFVQSSHARPPSSLSPACHEPTQ